MDIIRVKDLIHRFIRYNDNGMQEGENTALDGVTVDIAEGSFVAVLGHNGSGKSTFAKHLDAILLPSEGEVLVEGMDSKEEANLWHIRQSVGMVFQNPDNQIVANVVEEDVAFGPENLGVPTQEIWQRVNNSLEAVRMTAYRRKSPNKLSGGQKQRVAIAGTMAMKPDIIVLDEPTAMLDPSGRKEVIETIHRLNREEGITILLITHNMEEAVDADRIIIIDKGLITDDGTPREIFSRVEHMHELHLDVPQVTELAWRLKKEGIDLPEGILNIDEFLAAWKESAGTIGSPVSISLQAASCSETAQEEKQEQAAEGEDSREHFSLEIKELTHIYDPDAVKPVAAVKDVSLTIGEGEFIGVIGHTGSGKSTLIQHFNGLMKPTKGKVLFCGEDIWADGYSRQKLRSRVGLVFQYPEYQLFEETVFKDVCFGPLNQGLSREKAGEYAKEAMAMAGLNESLCDRSPFELSGGQKRRAAIAGVLAMKPQILILDEPTAGLDPKGRDDILYCLDRLHRENGITVVLVTHSMEDVAEHATRLIVIDEGKVAFDAAPAEVFRHTDELERMGLAVPEVSYLCHRLAQNGVPVSQEVITVSQAVRVLGEILREGRQ